MVIDQKRKTIYSSYTGETVNVGDTLDDNETAVIKPAGVTKIIDEYEHKISYKTLASLVGKGATAYDIAYAMAGIFLAYHGVAIASIVTLIYSALKSDLYSKIINGIANNLSGGVKITIYKCEITKHQGSRIVKGVGYKIGSIGLYG